MNKRLTVNIIGLGYIGLPTAAIIAKNGHRVLGVDIDQELVDKINQGQFSNLEPGLDEALEAASALGNLRASCEAESANVHMICVPTPLMTDSALPMPDMSYIFEAIKSLIDILREDDLLLIESTIPVGLSAQVSSFIEDIRSDLRNVDIAHCPERVIPGNMMWELVNNDRIVGGLSDEATDRAAEFYRSFVKGEVVKTNAQTAELCKLSENSFRDVNIAFANELSMICDQQNVDIWELIELANRHPRVNILQPGVGVGGHCIAVDPWFIVANNEQDTKIIQTARQVNTSKTDWAVEKIKSLIKKANNNGVTTPKIGCLGIAFKPDVDDVRESPALDVVERLINAGNNVMVVDPNVANNMPFELFKLEEVLRDADILVVLVKHQEFKGLTMNKIVKSKLLLNFGGKL
jgi:UDP-N-acetyl-D-mannosaminuronic acid dehydrogenase